MKGSEYLGQCFSTTDNFAPKEAFDDVWKYFWLSHIEGSVLLIFNG